MNNVRKETQNEENINIVTRNDGTHIIHHKKNIYPTLRHILLAVCVIAAFLFIIFLIHQNGKSIYDNGL